MSAHLAAFVFDPTHPSFRVGRGAWKVVECKNWNDDTPTQKISVINSILGMWVARKLRVGTVQNPARLAIEYLRYAREGRERTPN